MSRKGAPATPKRAPGAVTPMEVEDSLKKLGIDIKNSFGIKARKPKIGKQNQATPDTGSRHSFPLQEPDEVWEDYAHLLYDDNPEVKTAEKREGLGFLTGYEENHISVEDLLVGLVWCDKELDSYRSGAGLAHACTPPSLSIDGHTDTDALSCQNEHNKESVILHNDDEVAQHESLVKANEVVSGIESDGNESDWEQLHAAPPPLVMTEEERLEMQDDGGFEFVHHFFGPEDVVYDDDTISELGASVAPEDGTAVLGDSAEVMALRAEVERVRAENALLRRNYS